MRSIHCSTSKPGGCFLRAESKVHSMNRSLASLAARRLGSSILLFAIVLTLTFFLIRLAPGDPSRLIDDAKISPEYRESLRALWGLDQPILEQYVRWMSSIVWRGDWGISFSSRRPVSTLVAERVPATLLLAGVGITLQFLVGLLLGIAAARRAGSKTDNVLRTASILLYALPVFWTGLMALSLFSYRLGWLPGGAMRTPDAVDWGLAARSLDFLRHLLLPSVILAAAATGATLRFARNSLLEVLGEEFIRTARAKGLSETRVVWVHALRSAATPLVQLLGLSLPFLLSGSLIVEAVFSWPGLGDLAWQAAIRRDYPVIMATTALSGFLVILGNLFADLCQVFLDPRMRE